MANTLELGNGKWATGKDTVLAFNDQNNNFKPLPFSFSRASSATVVNKDGLIETAGSGEPRIDFKDNTKGALLLEPERMNLVTNSELLNTWFTTKSSGAVITDNYGIAPNGLQNSSRIQLASSDYCLRGLSLSTNSTSSVYVKGIIGETIQFGVGANVAQGGIFTFNGFWQRIEYTYQNGSGSILFSNLQGSATATDFEAFGLQVEDNVTYATSYIPTSGSAVTRVADYLMLKSFQNTILNNGVSPFALFLDLQNYKLESNGNTGLNFYDESINYNTQGRAYLYNTSAGFGQGWNDNPVPFTNNSSVKLLWNYTSSTEGYIFSNGTKGGLNSGTATSGFDYLELKGQFNTLLINQILIYNTALTEQEAIALTTI